MKNILFLLLTVGFLFSPDVSGRKPDSGQPSISFNVRGNGKHNVSLGVGSKPGTGACCRGVSKESTAAFQGQIGDVLYDAQTKRIISKVYKELEGKTIDLRQYY